MDHELVILGDFTVAVVPSCECGNLEKDADLAEATFLTDMVDDFIHFGVCEEPLVSEFARRLGVMV